MFICDKYEWSKIIGHLKKRLKLKDYYDAWEKDVDNLSTDLWGGAGPDCCTTPG